MIKKTLSTILFTFIAIVILITGVSAAFGTVTGESERTTENITINGKNTGVTVTQMNLSGYYGSNKVLTVTEGNLSNTNLSLEALNCGSKLVTRTLLTTACNSASTNGKTVLAAINGDLWMTNVNSNSNVTTKTLCTTRGITLIDGEIWATQEFGMENYANTSNATTTASDKSAIGTTSDNQPIVGIPVYTVSLKNETDGKTLIADGINRLPAWDSLVVYNSRLNTSNYALNDSYEVELSATNTAFTVNNTLTATVKAIYPNGSTTRPTIGSNTILLTARGSRISDLSDFTVGDTVSFDISLVDKAGRTEMWQNVTDAIGGHMNVLMDGDSTYYNTSTSEYPTSLIGIKDDGAVMMATVSASSSGVYKGLKFKDAEKLCRELGYNSVFYLDGGGSATMVTLKDGTYTVRNKTSDGSPRSVVNGVALVWNDTPVCAVQGSLSYINTPDDYNSLNPEYLSGSLINRVSSGMTNCIAEYSSTEDAFKIATDRATGDPYVTVNYSNFSKIMMAEDYKYIVIKTKTDASAPKGFSLFYCIGANTSASGSYMTSFTSGSSYSYTTINTSTLNGWSGKINNIRLDPLEGTTSPKGTSAYVEFIAFCKTAADAQKITKGVIPDGACKNFNNYKDCDDSHKYSAGTSLDTSTHRTSCSHCGFTVTDNHSLAYKTLQNATCTAEGVRAYGCSVCNYTQSTETIPALSHEFNDYYTVDVEPTGGSAGEKSRHCKNCDARTDISPVYSRKKGDINGDDSISTIDLNLMRRTLLGYTLDNHSAYAADLNNSDSVDTVDLNLIKRKLINP